jgi:cytochrome c553
MKSISIIRATTAAVSVLALSAGLARAADSKEIWEKSCASCHGKDGRGDTRMGKKLEVKDYTDPKVQDELKDDKATKTIKEGLKDDAGKVRMKPYADALSDDDIKGLIAYIRAFKKP